MMEMDCLTGLEARSLKSIGQGHAPSQTLGRIFHGALHPHDLFIL